MAIQIFRQGSGPISEMIDCGWHLSYFMSLDEIIRKINSFSHIEYNTDEMKNKEHIKECLKNGNDLFKRKDNILVRYIHDDFPECFKKFNKTILEIQELT